MANRFGLRSREGRPVGLWAEIGLTLAVIALAALVLNGGLLWLVVREVQVNARAQTARALASSVAGVLTEAGSGAEREIRYKAVFANLRREDLEVLELYVADMSMRSLASVRGEPPRTLDAGFREAFFGRTPHVTIGDRFSHRASVTVTQPVSSAGQVVAALRLTVPVEAATAVESPLGLLFLQTVFSGSIIGLAGYLLLRQRFVEPVQKLLDGTRRIASGDFTHRVDVQAAREIMDLTRSLNDMAASLGRFREETGTQVKSLEEANRALALAQQQVLKSARLASVGRLSAGIAHEIGNPLAAVVGYVEILRQSPDDADLARDLVERIHREVGRIHRIVGELLANARPVAGRPAPSDIRGVLDGAIAAVAGRSFFRDIRIIVEADEELPTLLVDAEKLHQVFVNILLNAADAMRGAGVIRIVVRSWSEEKGDLVRVGFHDSGAGFSQEALEHLFEPFFSTKGPGEGFGLGLVTSLSIVESFSGSLTVGNRPEGGALVEVELPCAKRPRTGSSGEET